MRAGFVAGGLGGAIGIGEAVLLEDIADGVVAIGLNTVIALRAGETVLFVVFEGLRGGVDFVSDGDDLA